VRAGQLGVRGKGVAVGNAASASTTTAICPVAPGARLPMNHWSSPVPGDGAADENVVRPS
jgi:hypothetical protein